MSTLDGLALRLRERADAAEPALGAARHDARHRDRRAARHRSGADVAVLLPVTFGLDPVSAFIMFGGIYYGAMYGGSTTSILLNTPGETGAIATAIDGHQMARSGRGAAALTTAALGSFVAGTLATLALALFAPALASVALAFGPAEYFALAIVAFAAVTALLGASLARGLFSLFLGLALGLVGIDQLTASAILVRHPAASRRHRRRHSRDRALRRRRDALSSCAARRRRAASRSARAASWA